MTDKRIYITVEVEVTTGSKNTKIGDEIRSVIDFNYRKPHDSFYIQNCRCMSAFDENGNKVF